MSKKHTYVINVNTYTISLTAIEYIDNGYYCAFYNELKHGGIKNNFFVNPDTMLTLIENLVRSCESKLSTVIKSVYVMLPQKFFRTKHNTVSIDTRVDVPINKFDVNNVLNKSPLQIEDCEFIDCIPIAYRTHEDYIDNPIGKETNFLEALTVTVGILVRIKEFLLDISKRLDIEFEIMPITTPILDKLQDELCTYHSPRILINVNEGATDVCYCEMKAVIASKTIEWGEQHFIHGIADVCGITDDEGEMLLSHINLNTYEKDEYVIFTDKIKVFDSKIVNKRMVDLLEYVLKDVKEAIKSLVDDSLLPICITGSSVALVKGFCEVCEKQLGMAVKVFAPNVLQWKTPKDYAIIGLLDKISKN